MHVEPSDILLLIIILCEPQSKAAIDLVLGICLPVHVEPSDILHGSSCNLIMVTSAALVAGHCLEQQQCCGGQELPGCNIEWTVHRNQLQIKMYII